MQPVLLAPLDFLNWGELEVCGEGGLCIQFGCSCIHTKFPKVLAKTEKSTVISCTLVVFGRTCVPKPEKITKVK